MEQPYTVHPARYAKGKLEIRTRSRDGYKSHACRLVADGLGLRYTGRCDAYIASPSQAVRFERLYAAGFDASWVAGDLERTERGLRGLTWREADKLAKEWAATARRIDAQQRNGTRAG